MEWDGRYVTITGLVPWYLMSRGFVNTYTITQNYGSSIKIPKRSVCSIIT